MALENVSFAKIVANPSVYAWSQAYNAGKLFAVLSLETEEEVKEKDYLNVLGKEVLDILEQEFFTLETKGLESIKKAVLETSAKVPPEIILSFVIGAFVDNILYTFILGNGKVSLKRNENLGNLLETNDQKPDSIKSASGFLEEGDVILLQTKQFTNIISPSILSEFLDNLSPQEAAENIAPLVHEKEESGAAAIIINYKKAVEIEEQGISEETETAETEKSLEEEPAKPGKINFFAKAKPFFGKVKLSGNLNINHSRKVILTIVTVIIVVLLASIVFAVKKQQDTKVQTLFSQIYPEASKKYQEGQGLLDLNRNLGRDSFSQAQKILEGGKDKFPKNSKEEKQILELLTKVNLALSENSGVTQTQAKEVESSSSSLLFAETKNTGLYFTQDDKNIYSVTANEVYTLNKQGNDKKTIIENDNSWQQIAGLAVYNGNVYVLDKKQNQILKFVATSNGFSEGNYFSSTKPEFSKAISLAIDNSVYVLSTDGTINKFTKGTQDSFSVSGLDNSFLNPTRIFTNAVTDNIYVLDNGNLRIVVLDKTGSYKSQYKTDVIKNAKDFDVLEKDKKIFVLSSAKVYQIDLK